MKAFLLRRQDLGYDSVLGIERYSEQGIKGVRNDELPGNVAALYDLCIRWGCTSNVPQRKVLNTAEAIHRVFDKPAFRKTLFDNGLTLPVYTDVGDQEVYPYPLVVRPGHHQEGAEFHVVNTDREFWRASVTCGAGWYAAPFVQKQAEYRINCLQGRVLCVIEKAAADAQDVVFGRGIVTIHYWSDWPMEACEKALKAMELSGLDFGGVDVIVGPDGKAQVLEINSGPWLEGKYQQKVFAKGFDYILRTENKKHLPMIEGPNSWKRFIHPGISDKAMVV